MCQWIHMFKSNRKNIHDIEKSSRPSLFSDELVQISELSEWFPHISRASHRKVRLPEVLCSVGTETTVDGMGSYHITKQTKKDLASFVCQEGYGKCEYIIWDEKGILSVEFIRSSFFNLINIKSFLLFERSLNKWNRLNLAFVQKLEIILFILHCFGIYSIR